MPLCDRHTGRGSLRRFFHRCSIGRQRQPGLAPNGFDFQPHTPPLRGVAVHVDTIGRQSNPPRFTQAQPALEEESRARNWSGEMH